MYQIGNFSKITNITIKALRYYDEQGILTLFCRAEKGYRYYDEGDLSYSLTAKKSMIELRINKDKVLLLPHLVRKWTATFVHQLPKILPAEWFRSAGILQL